MRLLNYAASSTEPVSVEEARTACRIDDSILDSQIQTQIAAAREQAETGTGKFFRERTTREELTDWPSGAIELALWNPTAVVVRYRSASAPTVWTVLSSSAYRWCAKDPKTWISRVIDTEWPTLATADWGNRVQIDVTTSPDTTGATPDAVRSFILASVAAWIANPEGLMQSNMAENPLFARLLDGERTWA